VGLDDGPVHARSEAEIISIDDQSPHAASLAGQRSPSFCDSSLACMCRFQEREARCRFFPTHVYS
jgi:hypothetical protein